MIIFAMLALCKVFISKVTEENTLDKRNRVKITIFASEM